MHDREDEIEIGWEETERGLRATTFRNGNWEGELCDSVCVRNHAVEDTLNLDHCIIGCVQEILEGNQVRILKFLRPDDLSLEDILGFDLDHKFELIIDEQGRNHPLIIDIGDILNIFKIRFCQSPNRNAQGCSELSYFCRYILKKSEGGRRLQPTNFCFLVLNHIAYTPCDCESHKKESALQSSLPEEVMSEMDTSCGSDHFTIVLSEKRQNSPNFNSPRKAKVAVEQRRKSLCSQRRTSNTSKENQITSQHVECNLKPSQEYFDAAKDNGAPVPNSPCKKKPVTDDEGEYDEKETVKDLKRQSAKVSVATEESSGSQRKSKRSLLKRACSKTQMESNGENTEISHQTQNSYASPKLRSHPEPTINREMVNKTGSQHPVEYVNKGVDSITPRRSKRSLSKKNYCDIVVDTDSSTLSDDGSLTLSSNPELANSKETVIKIRSQPSEESINSGMVSHTRRSSQRFLSRKMCSGNNVDTDSSKRSHQTLNADGSLTPSSNPDHTIRKEMPIKMGGQLSEESVSSGMDNITLRRSGRCLSKISYCELDYDTDSSRRSHLTQSSDEFLKPRSRRSSTNKREDTPRPAKIRRSESIIPEPSGVFSKPHRPVKRTRSLRFSTPSMPDRANALKVSESSLEKARSNLHVSSVPKALPCREKEYKNIYRFLEDKICDASGGCMYISGVPGTGKTATVHAVIRSLQEKTESKELPQFQFVEVNGLRLTEPRQVFVQLLKQLTGRKCAPQQARDILSKRFSSKDRTNKPVVLLLDEVDMLLNNRQDVVYNLFEWPNHARSQLIVLTIANTMDLPERLFMGRVTSRLGLTRLTFPAYSYKQLEEIVMSRLEGITSFNPGAVQLVARKVAAISGDARRALDICRRATELVSEGENITMKTIELAFEQMLNSSNVKAIKACSKMEKLFLKAAVMEKERTGIEEISFHSLYRQFRSICILDCGWTPQVTEGMALLSKLGSSRLFLTEHARCDLHQTVYLNVSADDIHYALNDRSHDATSF